MDQGLIQNLKMHYRRDFMSHLVNYEKETIEDFQKMFNVKDAIFTISLAWNSVKTETCQRCWRKLWPMAIFTDEEGEADFEGFRTRPLRKVVRRRQSALAKTKQDMNEKEIERWINIDNDVPIIISLDYEEIISNVLAPNTEENKYEEEEEAMPKVSWKAASEALDTFISFAEQSTYMNTHGVMQLHIIKNEFLRERAKASRQGDIREMLKKFTKKKNIHHYGRCYTFHS